MDNEKDERISGQDTPTWVDIPIDENQIRTVETTSPTEAKKEKGSFRKSNAATLVFQILFTVLCGLLSIAVFYILFLFASMKKDPGAALGFFFFGSYFMPIISIVAGLLIIPFILFMILCKRPWIALAGYGVLFLSTAIYWIIFLSGVHASGGASNALQYLQVFSSLI